LNITATNKDFFTLAIKSEALLFGNFTLKSGVKSTYFFNMAAIIGGGAIYEIASMYADIILEQKIEFDSIFGPAYKGIPLAAAIASIFYEREGRRIPLTFDRKETKSYGEGGNLIGADLKGKILVVDDVLTAGTALKYSADLIDNQGGKISAVIVGLDREEKIEGLLVKNLLEKKYGFLIKSIATASSLLNFLESDNDYSREAHNLIVSLGL